MIKPFIITIITSIVLAYVFHPLFKKVKRKVKKGWLASILITVGVVLLIILPSFAMLNTLTSQAIGVYATTSGLLEENQETLSEVYTNMESRFGVSIELESVILSVVDFFVNSSKEFLKTLPQKIINFFIMIFLLYYLLKDGDKVTEKATSIIPINAHTKKKLIKGAKELTNAVIFGSILTALIQGLIGAIGFMIFGIESPIFWGLMMAIFALIPFLGTAIIWVPAALILFFKGIILNSGLLIGKGIGLFIYGLILVSTIDNFIKPKLIGQKGKLHPAIVLLGILGGLSLFGVIGIIIGPIILALFLALVKIYSEEYGI